eukprot:jgi/Psemu1/42974/gm1.42974_g
MMWSLNKRYLLLTRKCSALLVEKLDDLFTAKLEVIFLSRTDAQNIDEHFGKEASEVYLTAMFKHLKESLHHDFIPPWLVQYRVNDSDSKRDQSQDKGNNGDDRNITNGSLDNKNSGLKLGANNSNESGNNGDNVSDPSQNKVNKSDKENVKDGSLDNNGDKKNAAKNSNESGNTTKTKTVGAKPLSGEAQRKKKGKLLEDDNSKSSSDSEQVSVNDPSTSTSDNEKGLEFDPDNNDDCEGEEDNECQ